MYYQECRDLGFGIDSLANGLGRVGSFDLGRRIDEFKEQKALNIVGESNIERKLWWDLGSIDIPMSRSRFLGRTFGKTTCWTIYQFVRLFFALWDHRKLRWDLRGSCWFMPSRQMHKHFDETMCLKDR